MPSKTLIKIQFLACLTKCACGNQLLKRWILKITEEGFWPNKCGWKN